MSFGAGSRDASNRLDSARVADVIPSDQVRNSVGGGPRFRSAFAVGQAVSVSESPIDRCLELVEPRTAGRIDTNQVHTRRPRRSHDQAPIELEVARKGSAGRPVATVAVHTLTAARTVLRADSVSGRPSMRTISAVGNPSDLSHRASDGSNSWSRGRPARRSWKLGEGEGGAEPSEASGTAPTPPLGAYEDAFGTAFGGSSAPGGGKGAGEMGGEMGG